MLLSRRRVSHMLSVAFAVWFHRRNQFVWVPSLLTRWVGRTTGAYDSSHVSALGRVIRADGSNAIMEQYTRGGVRHWLREPVSIPTLARMRPFGKWTTA